MSNIARQYSIPHTPFPLFGPMPDPTHAPRIRHTLERLVAVRDTGRDLDGYRLDLDPDEVIEGINMAEASLRPRAVRVS